MPHVTATGMDALRRQLELCRERLRLRTLEEGDLEQALQLLEQREAGQARGHQDLLFIQSCNTHLGSTILGLSMVVDGVCQDPPLDPEQWPYGSVLAAIADGWRIISFPNQLLMMDGPSARGLGCEYILERWSNA